MSARVKVAQVIERPVAEVFQFIAVDHVRNHPRWDPDMELEKISDGPIRVGTMIRRHNSRSGNPVEGTMEVVEFEPNRAMSTINHDGDFEIRGRITFEAESPERTTINFDVEFPSMDESTDTSLIRSLIERSARNMKQLIESER